MNIQLQLLVVLETYACTIDFMKLRRKCVFELHAKMMTTPHAIEECSHTLTTMFTNTYFVTYIHNVALFEKVGTCFFAVRAR